MAWPSRTQLVGLVLILAVLVALALTRACRGGAIASRARSPLLATPKAGGERT
jgi:hypothetical protein